MPETLQLLNPSPLTTLTEDEILFRDNVRQFADDRIRPLAKEMDEKAVFDHGLLYGDGIFEGIRAYNGRVFKLREHIDRLYCSAKAILLSIPLSPQEMSVAVVETCRARGI